MDPERSPVACTAMSSSPPRSCAVELVRHGEVDNPRHVVYADLPGFRLSERGRRQAEAVADHLAGLDVALVVCSPLERAVATARPIAARHGLEPLVEPDLVEWRLASRWKDVPWEEIPTRFPGELEAYLAHPDALPFSPEPLAALAGRMVLAVERHCSPKGVTVFVTHQDPLQAARLALTGRPLRRLRESPPGHGAAIRLRRDGSTGGWREVTAWEPPQGERFPPPPRPGAPASP